MNRILFCTVLPLFLATVALAQSTSAVCWRNPKPGCDVTVITELHVDAVIVSSERRVVYESSFPAAEETHPGITGPDFGWDVGILKRVGARQAVGGVFQIGGGNSGLRTAAKVRGRHYLGEQTSVELEAGLVRAHVGGVSAPPTTGLTSSVRFNVADKLSLFVGYDDLAWPDPRGGFYQYQDTVRARGLRGGAALGSLPAVIGTAAGGLGYLVLLGLFIAAGGAY